MKTDQDLIFEAYTKPKTLDEDVGNTNYDVDVPSCFERMLFKKLIK